MTIRQAGLAAVIVLAASPLGAQSVIDEPRQVFDLATVTCKQFMGLPMAGMGIRIIYWLDGYYRDDVEPAVIDADKHKQMLVALGEYCEKNETHGLITAADKLFEKKK